MTGASAALVAVLEEARTAGLLGPGAVTEHVRRAAAFVRATAAPARALDLGSGGGVPGLVLAEWWPGSAWVLLDRSDRRTGFLRRAVLALGWSDRVVVEHAPAETAGRDPALRGSMDVVVARSFGPPAVTAECGAPFLRLGGRLLVAEPPAATARWPADGLAELGLVCREAVDAEARVQVLEAQLATPARYPRRPGVPTRKPLW